MTAIDALPPVTVAIPFYNAEAYLADAIRSVFAQTHTAWELLLIDDGSTDGSLAIAQSVQDPRVRVISDGRNMRLASRLNQITQLAKYDFIARMDADDLMSPDRLAVQAAILASRADIDLVSCGLYSVKNDLGLVGLRGGNCENYSFNDLLFKRKSFVHAALLARKDWYVRNAYNPLLPPIEDSELWLRAAKAGDFHAKSIAEPLYIYREEGNVVLKKLLAAYALERKHIAKLIDSPVLRVRFILRSFLKSSVSWALAAIGATAWLQSRRNKSAPSAAETSAYAVLISRIVSTRVPGMEPTVEVASSSKT